MSRSLDWESVIGQERAIATLRSAISGGRVAHAYLFHGPDGTGKRAAAIAFAHALLCTRESPPCGGCPQCGKVSRLVHPDLHVLLPQPADARPSDVRDRVLRLAEEPYATVDFHRRAKLDEPGSSSGKQVQYSVARVNEELRRIMSFRPVEGRYKVAILSDAHLLRKEAANAFLKLLEEPSAQTVFILTSPRPDRMLPTILSRCQHVRFDRLSIPQITQGLIDREVAQGSAAETIARMADGSFSRALELSASEDLMAAREQVLAFLRGSYQVWSAADRIAGQIERLSRQGREHIKFVLELMLSWIRDLNLVRVLGADAPLVNADQSGEIVRFSQRLADARPEVMAELVEECIVRIERNAHPRLVLTVLAQSLGQAMRGKELGSLAEPLTDAV